MDVARAKLGRGTEPTKLTDRPLEGSTQGLHGEVPRPRARGRRRRGRDGAARCCCGRQWRAGRRCSARAAYQAGKAIDGKLIAEIQARENQA